MRSQTVPYTTTETIYSGSRCVVYRAHRQDDGVSVILKELRAVPAHDGELARFRHEYELTRNLNLQGVIGCYELITRAGRHTMVLEDFGGESLDRLGAEGPIDLLTFLEIAYAASSALATLHECRVLHGNLNPSNVIFNMQSGQLKLIDFGCAVDLSGASGANTTPRDDVEISYASPEQAEALYSEPGQHDAVDLRSDLYSLGVTLYELLTGRLPFEAVSTNNGVSPTTGKRPPRPAPPERLREDIPPRLSEIVLKLLESDPDRRYPTAGELSADLATLRMAHLTDVSRMLTLESAKHEQALLDLQEAYEEVQTQEEELREQQEELIATRARIESERQHYRELFALAPDGYLVTDLHGRIREVNQAAVALLGIDQHLAIGSLVTRFIPPSVDRDSFREFLRQLATNDTTLEWEGRITPTRGEPVDVVVRCSAFRNDTGAATEVRWLIRDVTARKRAEEALRLNEESFRTLAEYGQDVVYRVTLVPALTLDYVSPSVTAITGFTPEEIYADPDFRRTLLADLVDEDRALIDEITRNSEPLPGTMVLRWRRKDGNMMWVELRNTPIYNEEGKVVGVAGVARDITARKLAEAALQEREYLIEKITTNSPQIIYIFDVNERRIVYSNRRLGTLLGYATKRDQPMTLEYFVGLIHPDDVINFKNFLQRLFDSSEGELHQLEARVRHAEGGYRWFSTRYVVFSSNPDGTIAQILGTIEDVTERKEVERALRESETRFRTSIDNIQDAFGIYSAIRDDTGKIVDFKIEYVNPMSSLLNQLSAEEMIGHTLREFLPPGSEAALEKYARVVDTGEPLSMESWVFEQAYERLDSRALDLRAAKFGDGFVATWRDVTERKEREELLLARERFIERIAEVTPGIIYLLDLAEQRMLYINDQVKDIVGLTPQEILDSGTSFIEGLQYSEIVPATEQITDRVMHAKDGEVIEWEQKMTLPQGGSLWLLTRSVVFERDSTGTPTQLLAVAYDIAERKKIEQTVRQANEDLYARVEELSALNRISQILTKRTDLSVSLAAVCSTLLYVFKASEASVSELTSSRAELNVLAHVRRGLSGSDMTGRTIPLRDDPVAQYAVQAGDQVVILPGGEGLPPQVSGDRHAMRDPDAKDGRLYTPAVKSLIMLPLWSRGSVTGLLSIASDQEDTAWSLADVRLAQTVAGTVANAIESARLFNEELKQRSLVESLNEVGNALTSSLDIDTVLQTIFEQLNRVLVFDGAAIFLREDDDLVETQAVGISAHNVGYRFRDTSKGPQIRVLQTGRAECISDTHEYKQWTPPGGNKLVRSWMGAPLIIGDRKLGIVTISHTQPNTYTAEHLRVLQSFANEAAIGINNATLYLEGREKAAHEERNRLARELHDSVTQSLFSANLVAKVMPELARQNPERFEQALETLARLTQTALAEMRTMLMELRPASLTQTPLDTALRNLSVMITSRWPLEFMHPTFDPVPPLAEEVQLALYRIVQETLTNITKHAQAQSVEFNLRVLPPFHQGDPHQWKGEIAIHIADDGQGFDIRTVPPGHMGLQIMSERAASIGATLEMSSQPGRGTQMTIIWAGEAGGSRKTADAAAVPED